MIIGFGNGDFWKLQKQELDRFENSFLEKLLQQNANGIELHCRDLDSLNFILQNKIQILKEFAFVSVHAVDFAYSDDVESHKLLSATEKISILYNINNVVFHTDKVLDWSVVASYEQIPISIENMDDRKKIWSHNKRCEINFRQI